jgi:hypothetical protein
MESRDLELKPLLKAWTCLVECDAMSTMEVPVQQGERGPVQRAIERGLWSGVISECY